jgi:hypothetical protein
MRIPFTTLVTAAVLTALPVAAQAQTSPKGPPKTMGDEGKLPATGNVGGHVPDMGATQRPASSGAGSNSPKGPSKTMGDKGKLPATGTVSGEVPKMNPGK